MRTSPHARVRPGRLSVTLGAAVLAGAALLVAQTASGAAAVTKPPAFAHIVVVMEENHSYADIIGSRSAPYLNALAGQGATFTKSYAVTHPSEPNYLALFSGSTHGLTRDACPLHYTGNSLGQQVLNAHKSFAGYAENLPSQGSLVCSSGAYARKHVPWTDFGLPASTDRRFGQFPSTYSNLPALSFVIPNLDHDMHDGTVAAGDTWLKSRLGGYVTWAKTHNSILVVTWDEDDRTAANHIPTIVVGAHVKRGRFAEKITHYRVLRTLEDSLGVGHLGAAAAATPITDIWG
jgi:acid phosphatase